MHFGGDGGIFRVMDIDNVMGFCVLVFSEFLGSFQVLGGVLEGPPGIADITQKAFNVVSQSLKREKKDIRVLSTAHS